MSLPLLAGAGLAAGGCSKDKPTREQCERACEHAVELDRAHYDKAALARIPPDKQAKARTKMKAEWRKARKGKLKDRIDDCAVQCVSEGDLAGVQCVLNAKTVGEAHRCRTGSRPTRKARRPRPARALEKIRPRPLHPVDGPPPASRHGAPTPPPAGASR